jgi:hypothetical protein
MTTNATNKGGSSNMSAFYEKFLYQCDLKWELPFLVLTKDFRFKCVFSSCKQHFHCRKIRKKAKDVGGPVEFIDQQYAKRSLIPKR